MKTILVATDFSPAAMNATHYAADMALAINADIFLLHVFQIPHNYGEIPGLKDTEAIMQDAVSGTIISKNQYQVYANTGGIISKRYVAENDVVKAGTPLFRIDDKSSSHAKDNARLAAQNASVPANQPMISDSKNAITLAQAKYENDSLLFKRQEALWSQGIGSRYELEQRELASINSKTSFQSAVLKYRDLLWQLQFNAAQSNNTLAINEVRQGDLIVKSEISGKVYSLFKEQGEMVNPQTPIAIIGDAAGFLIQLQIDEYDIVKIKTDQKVLVSMDSYKGQAFEATITRVYPIMNERTRSFLAEAVFVSPPATLYPNLSLEANVVLQEKKNALTIPRNYLINDSMVLIDKDKTRRVTTGLMDYQKAEIVNGLKAKDVIYKPQ